MPGAVIARVVASAVSSAVVGSTIFGFTISTLGAAVIGGLAAAGTGMLFADKPDAAQSGGFESTVRDSLVTVRQPISHWQWIYGRARVRGAKKAGAGAAASYNIRSVTCAQGDARGA